MYPVFLFFSFLITKIKVSNTVIDFGLDKYDGNVPL